MTAAQGPRGFHLGGFVLDEASIWVRSVKLAYSAGDDQLPDNASGVWAVKGSMTAQFPFKESPGWRRLMRQLEAELAARRTLMITRLAVDLLRPRFLVRRQVDAVDRVLEAAGIADGYGQLASHATRRPIPLPPRRR